MSLLTLLRRRPAWQASLARAMQGARPAAAAPAWARSMAHPSGVGGVGGVGGGGAWRGLATGDGGDAKSGDGEAAKGAEEDAGQQAEAEESEEEREERLAAELKAKAEKLFADKKEAEVKRFEREREEYRREMRKLRKEWKQEALEDARAQLKDREDRIRKGREKQLLKERLYQEAKAKALAERTSLELSALEAYKQQYQKSAEERRAHKMERRKEVLEKLHARQIEVEQEKAAMLEALAREAHLWFTKEDLDNGTLDAKLNERLVAIQPITASFHSALPLRHHEDAQMFITDDSDMIFDEEAFEEMLRNEFPSAMRR